MIAEAVYILCAITSGLCAVMLLRKYRDNHTRLLMWSCLCFVGLAINNVFLFIDLIVVPEIDLSTLRMLPALIGLGILITGFVWDAI